MKAEAELVHGRLLVRLTGETAADLTYLTEELARAGVAVSYTHLRAHET